VPDYSPSAAGKRAIELYDTNGDGVISGAELDKCPALKRALSRYDTGGDGKVTAENIAARIQTWKNAKSAGLVHLVVRLTLDGEPLSGATVTLDPEPFLGDAAKRLVGTTSEFGSVSPIAEGAVTDGHTPVGAIPGLYKIRISKKSDGKETIPARYNAQTELGVEVASDSPDARSLKIDLQSK